MNLKQGIHLFILYSYLLLLPQLSWAEESIKKNFYPGKSLFFWLLIAIAIFFIYTYKTSTHKKGFFKSSFHRTILLALGAITASYLLVNICFKEPQTSQIGIVAGEKVLSTDSLLKLDEYYAKKTELEFKNTDLHFSYLSHHFLIPDKYKNQGYEEVRDDFTIHNFYYDHLFFSDSHYVNIARLSLGIYYYKKNQKEYADMYLKKVTEDLPYLHFYKAKLLLDKSDTIQAIPYLYKALKNSQAAKNDIVNLLVLSLKQSDRYAELNSLLQDQSIKKLVPVSVAREIYYRSGDLPAYTSSILRFYSEKFKWTGFIAALGIFLAWFIYITVLDIFEKEKLVYLIATFLAGVLFSFLSFYLYDLLSFTLLFDGKSNVWANLLYCITGIGLIEESVKLIPLLILFFFTKDIVNEPYDFVLYACISALGFGLAENILYFDASLFRIVNTRALSAAPGHMIFSSIAAYGIVLSQYRYNKFPLGIAIPSFLLLAAINHGLYDFWLLNSLYPLFLLHLAISISIWILIINNSLNNSPAFNYQLKLRRNRMQWTLAVCLLSVVVLEYILVAWEEGPALANSSLNYTILVSGIFIIFYSDRLSNIDLVKNYWFGFPFRSIEEKQHGEKFRLSHFLWRLVAGSTFPHSFSGLRIILKTASSNRGLSKFFTGPVEGIVQERLVVICESRDQTEEYADPNWFVLKTDKPIYTASGVTEDSFIIRFADSRPTFIRNQFLLINLYVLKKDELPGSNLRKINLRSLGKCTIRQII